MPFSLFKYLFGQNRPPEETPAPVTTRVITIPDLAPAAYRVAHAFKTDPGCIRENNEDNGVVLPGDPESGQDFLAVIADGMGGHAAGEVASRIATEVIPAEYAAAPAKHPGQALHDALVLANAEIFEQAQGNPQYRNMGTTCVAVAIRKGRLFHAHVGDSRLYRLRQDTLTQLTEDHSYVMQLVKEGRITREEAARHEDKNVILRAMGTRAQVEVDFTEEGLPIETGDKYLLCTDGLTDVVPDSEIAGLLQLENPDDATTQLVELAKKNGGPDNITVILMDIRSTKPETDNNHHENNQP